MEKEEGTVRLRKWERIMLQLEMRRKGENGTDGRRNSWGGWNMYDRERHVRRRQVGKGIKRGQVEYGGEIWRGHVRGDETRGGDRRGG
jgi:hypothetical protein